MRAPPVPSLFARAAVAAHALRGLALDEKPLAQALNDRPSRDHAFKLAESLNAAAIAHAVMRLAATDEGRRMLEERPRIDRVHVDFETLRRLPEGTLGREYIRFLDDNGISPDVWEELPDVGYEYASWLTLRIRQTHDLWHVVTGYATDAREEILLQGFHYAQFPSPSALVLLAFGAVRWLRLRPQDLVELRRAYRRGKATRCLLAVRWEDFWGTPMSELRATLSCPSA